MKREHVVGLIVVVLLVAGGLWWRGRRAAQTSTVPPAEGEGVVIEDRASQLAKQMGVVLPSNGEKIDLKDVSGGAASGLATRSFSDNRFDVAILAALPDPQAGTWYEGWLVRHDPFEAMDAGKLRMAKGGFVLEFTSSRDLRDHTQVVVTEQKASDGNRPGVHVLEGEFKQ